MDYCVITSEPNGGNNSYIVYNYDISFNIEHSASLIDLENNDKIFVCLNELRLFTVFFLQYMLLIFSIRKALSVIEHIQLDRCQYPTSWNVFIRSAGLANIYLISTCWTIMKSRSIYTLNVWTTTGLHVACLHLPVCFFIS